MPYYAKWLQESRYVTTITIGCRKLASFAPTFQFRTANLAAPSGIVIAALLLFGLGNYGRDFQVLAGAIDGYERQVGGCYVLGRVGNVILNEDLHTHFHRAVEDAINRGAKDDKIRSE